MYPDDPDVLKVQKAFFDPFEYLWLRHKGDALNTQFFVGAGGHRLPSRLSPTRSKYWTEDARCVESGE